MADKTAQQSHMSSAGKDKDQILILARMNDQMKKTTDLLNTMAVTATHVTQEWQKLHDLTQKITHAHFFLDAFMGRPPHGRGGGRFFDAAMGPPPAYGGGGPAAYGYSYGGSGSGGPSPGGFRPGGGWGPGRGPGGGAAPVAAYPMPLSPAGGGVLTMLAEFLGGASPRDFTAARQKGRGGVEAEVSIPASKVKVEVENPQVTGDVKVRVKIPPIDASKVVATAQATAKAEVPISHGDLSKPATDTSPAVNTQSVEQPIPGKRQRRDDAWERSIRREADLAEAHGDLDRATSLRSLVPATQPKLVSPQPHGPPVPPAPPRERPPQVGPWGGRPYGQPGPVSISVEAAPALNPTQPSSPVDQIRQMQTRIAELSERQELSQDPTGKEWASLNDQIHELDQQLQTVLSAHRSSSTSQGSTPSPALQQPQPSATATASPLVSALTAKPAPSPSEHYAALAAREDALRVEDEQLHEKRNRLLPAEKARREEIHQEILGIARMRPTPPARDLTEEEESADLRPLYGAESLLLSGDKAGSRDLLLEYSGLDRLLRRNKVDSEDDKAVREFVSSWGSPENIRGELARVYKKLKQEPLPPLPAAPPEESYVSPPAVVAPTLTQPQPSAVSSDAATAQQRPRDPVTGQYLPSSPTPPPRHPSTDDDIPPYRQPPVSDEQLAASDPRRPLYTLTVGGITRVGSSGEDLSGRNRPARRASQRLQDAQIAPKGLQGGPGRGGEPPEPPTPPYVEFPDDVPPFRIADRDPDYVDVPALIKKFIADKVPSWVPGMLIAGAAGAALGGYRSGARGAIVGGALGVTGAALKQGLMYAHDRYYAHKAEKASAGDTPPPSARASLPAAWIQPPAPLTGPAPVAQPPLPLPVPVYPPPPPPPPPPSRPTAGVVPPVRTEEKIAYRQEYRDDDQWPMYGSGPRSRILETVLGAVQRRGGFPTLEAINQFPESTAHRRGVSRKGDEADPYYERQDVHFASRALTSQMAIHRFGYEDTEADVPAEKITLRQVAALEAHLTGRARMKEGELEDILEGLPEVNKVIETKKGRKKIPAFEESFIDSVRQAAEMASERYDIEEGTRARRRMEANAAIVPPGSIPGGPGSGGGPGGRGPSGAGPHGPGSSEDSRRSLERFNEALDTFSRRALTLGSALADSAAPDAMATLSASFKLLAAQVGTTLTPTIIGAARAVQDTARWFRDLNPAIKSIIGYAGGAALVTSGLYVGARATGLAALGGMAFRGVGGPAAAGAAAGAAGGLLGKLGSAAWGLARAHPVLAAGGALAAGATAVGALPDDLANTVGKHVHSALSSFSPPMQRIEHSRFVLQGQLSPADVKASKQITDAEREAFDRYVPLRPGRLQRKPRLEAFREQSLLDVTGPESMEKLWPYRWYRDRGDDFHPGLLWGDIEKHEKLLATNRQQVDTAKAAGLDTSLLNAEGDKLRGWLTTMRAVRDYEKLKDISPKDAAAKIPDLVGPPDPSKMKEGRELLKQNAPFLLDFVNRHEPTYSTPEDLHRRVQLSAISTTPLQEELRRIQNESYQQLIKSNTWLEKIATASGAPAVLGK